MKTANIILFFQMIFKVGNIQSLVKVLILEFLHILFHGRFFAVTHFLQIFLQENVLSEKCLPVDLVLFTVII